MRNAQMVAYEMYYLYKDANITDGATHYHLLCKNPLGEKIYIKRQNWKPIFYKQK